jgi:hypothetical protein
MPLPSPLVRTKSATTSVSPASAYNALAVGQSEQVVFSYVVSDGDGGTVQQTATISIAGANDAPTARDDAISGTEDTDITGNVLADNGAGADSDIDGDPLTISTTPASNVANGVLVLNADGSFVYTPSADFAGTDGFAYTVLDGQGGTGVGQVTLTVAPINDAPTILHQTMAGFDGATQNFAIRENFNDFPRQALTVDMTVELDASN